MLSRYNKNHTIAFFDWLSSMVIHPNGTYLPASVDVWEGYHLWIFLLLNRYSGGCPIERYLPSPDFTFLGSQFLANIFGIAYFSSYIWADILYLAFCSIFLIDANSPCCAAICHVQTSHCEAHNLELTFLGSNFGTCIFRLTFWDSHFGFDSAMDAEEIPCGALFAIFRLHSIIRWLFADIA